MQEVITSRQREVLELHYSFDGVATAPRTKEMVADMLGMAQQNINKSERSAMKRLYKVLAPIKGIHSDHYSPDEVMKVLVFLVLVSTTVCRLAIFLVVNDVKRVM